MLPSQYLRKVEGPTFGTCTRARGPNTWVITKDKFDGAGVMYLLCVVPNLQVYQHLDQCIP